MSYTGTLIWLGTGRQRHCRLVCGSGAVNARLRRELAAHGVLPNRLLFAGYMPREQHLR